MKKHAIFNIQRTNAEDIPKNVTPEPESYHQTIFKIR